MLLMNRIVVCHMQIWKVQGPNMGQYRYLNTYPCTVHLPGAAWFTMLYKRWYKCPFSDTDSTNACGPVDPAPFDNHHHVAVLPTCLYDLSNDCSLEEKLRNLGQANYAALITWDDYDKCRCSISRSESWGRVVISKALIEMVLVQCTYSVCLSIQHALMDCY